jgi:phosphonate transport system permease protein
VAAAALADFRPAALFEPGNLAAMGHFLAGFLPLETSPDFLALLGRATVDTLAMATAGIALAVLLAVPLGLVLTRSLSVAAIGPGRGWVGQPCAPRRGAAGGAARRAGAGVGAALRAGLRPRPGGRGAGAGHHLRRMLGKVYGEILESTDARPAACSRPAAGGWRRWPTGCCPTRPRSCCPTPCIAGNARCGPRW